MYTSPADNQSLGLKTRTFYHSLTVQPWSPQSKEWIIAMYICKVIQLPSKFWSGSKRNIFKKVPKSTSPSKWDLVDYLSEQLSSNCCPQSGFCETPWQLVLTCNDIPPTNLHESYMMFIKEKSLIKNLALTKRVSRTWLNVSSQHISVSFMV